MQRNRRVTFLLASALLGLITLVGCGGRKTVTIKGKVNLPSKVKLAENDSAELRFVNQATDGKSAAATLSTADSSFTTKIEPGKYKVVFRLSPYPGMPNSKERAVGLEPFNNSFTEKNTKLTVDIADKPDQTVTVDLDKGNVSVN